MIYETYRRALNPFTWNRDSGILMVKDLGRKDKQMSEAAEQWFAQAIYDLETAKVLFRSGRYVYTVFMCHLCLEKALKGLAAAVTGEIPPKTHNLIYLAKLTEPRLSKEQLSFLAAINTASIVTRYPEDLQSILAQYDRKMACRYIIATEEVLTCLRQDPRLKK